MWLSELKITPRYKWMYLIIILFGAIYLTIGFCDHYFFRTFAFDYGTYNFALYDYSHFRISECPVYNFGHMSFMQDHLSFTLFLFIPLYWIFGWLTGTYTLLIIQTLFILYGGWGVFKLMELKTADKYLPILALLQYFIIFGRWSAFVMDCNLAIIASSLVPVLIYYFEKRKFIYAFSAFVFILITREDMALWTGFIGLFLLISHYSDKELRLKSIAVMVISLLYFIVAFKLLIPYFETPDKKYSLFEYSALGKNPYDALKYILINPLKTITLLFVNQSGNKTFDNVKFEFYYVYLISGGFLFFFRPKYLLLFIPLLAKKMFNDLPIRWSVELYYSIEFVSILPVAVFLIISEFKNIKLKYSLAVLVSLLTISITIVKLIGHNHYIDWWGDSKFAFYKSSMYKAPFDEKKVYNHLAIIPPDAKVSMSNNIVSHLAFRDKPYFFPRVDDAEYLALLDYDRQTFSYEQYINEINKYKSDNKWNLIVDDPPLLIFKRKY
jgi:uncharacterized membrane protein